MSWRIAASGQPIDRGVTHSLVDAHLAVPGEERGQIGRSVVVEHELKLSAIGGHMQHRRRSATNYGA